jgi:isopenicillin N synthase-like dioxygenase
VTGSGITQGAGRASASEPGGDGGPGGAAPQISADAVPVVDISPLRGGLSTRDAEAVIGRLDDACVRTGFFVAVGHGMSSAIPEILETARALFGLPRPDKAAQAMADRCGYLDDGAKEMFDVAFDPSGSAPNRWPPVPLFRRTVEAYQAGALEVARVLLAALGIALGVGPTFFAEHMHRPQCYLRLLRYPPRPRGDVTTGAHSDYGALTLLATDGAAGLQVRPRGRPWIDLAAPAGAFVVNLGDLLARWTNDRYVSTPHRVVAGSAVDRYAVPFFVNPDPATVVTCLPSCTSDVDPARYTPVTAGEFLQGRIDGTISAAIP